MKLWTIQPLEVLEEINTKGYYICDINKSEFLNGVEQFKRRYDWLVKSMEKKIGRRPQGVEYPVWAWYKRDWKNKKPDLRERHGVKGEKLVCLELEIADERVVLSDFDAWCCVLNGGYLDMSRTEEEWQGEQAYIDRLEPLYKEKEIKRSWYNVFNITPFENDWRVVGRYVQATFWVLYKEDIKRVQIFKSR